MVLGKKSSENNDKELTSKDLEKLLSEMKHKEEEEEKAKLYVPTPEHSNGKASISLRDIYAESKSKTLVCHIMASPRKELQTSKTRIYAQEFMWKKRMWAISHDAIWYDKKGVGHYMVLVNDADGTLRLEPIMPDKQYLDKCVECGNAISIDAQNVRDLLKRKTINTFWGIDNTFVLLLLILGVAMCIMIGAMFYILGDNQATHKQLEKYLPPPSTTTTKGTTTTNGGTIVQK